MSWTDDPIIPEQTLVKGVHIDEVRERIDLLQDSTCPLHDSSALSGDLGTHLTGNDAALFTTENPDNDPGFHLTWYSTDCPSHFVTVEDGDNSNEDLGDYTSANPNHFPNDCSAHYSYVRDVHDGWFNNSIMNNDDGNNNSGAQTSEYSGDNYNNNEPIDASVNPGWYLPVNTNDHTWHQPSYMASYNGQYDTPDEGYQHFDYLT